MYKRSILCFLLGCRMSIIANMTAATIMFMVFLVCNWTFLQVDTDICCMHDFLDTCLGFAAEIPFCVHDTCKYHKKNFF